MINALENYGRILGILFQIVDDMLDYFSLDSRFGKNTGTDLRERKVTMPVILAYNTASPLDKSALQEIFSKPVGNDEEENNYFIQVKSLLDEYNVSAQIQGILQQYVEQGLRMLDVLPKGKAGEHLRNLLLSAPSRIY
jgi:octaprenyl-diphosphate synthase